MAVLKQIQLRYSQREALDTKLYQEWLNRNSIMAAQQLVAIANAHGHGEKMPADVVDAVSQLDDRDKLTERMRCISRRAVLARHSEAARGHSHGPPYKYSS